jgi:hypothetical protein
MSRMATLTEIDWAKLAAFIDGEGTIVIIKARKHYTQLVIRIANTDPRLPMWCFRNFGGKIYAYSGKGKQRRYFTWATQSQKAENILRMCLPHFLLKREQALVALEYRDTFRHRKGRTPEQELTVDRQAIRRAYKEELSRLKSEIPEEAFIGVPEPSTKLLQ